MIVVNLDKFQILINGDDISYSLSFGVVVVWFIIFLIFIDYWRNKS